MLAGDNIEVLVDLGGKPNRYRIRGSKKYPEPIFCVANTGPQINENEDVTISGETLLWILKAIEAESDKTKNELDVTLSNNAQITIAVPVFKPMLPILPQLEREFPERRPVAQEQKTVPQPISKYDQKNGTLTPDGAKEIIAAIDKLVSTLQQEISQAHCFGKFFNFSNNKNLKRGDYTIKSNNFGVLVALRGAISSKDGRLTKDCLLGEITKPIYMFGKRLACTKSILLGGGFSRNSRTLKLLADVLEVTPENFIKQILQPLDRREYITLQFKKS